MYGCFLDVSKAFDKVHYGKLFSLLMSKGLPKVVVRFILDGHIRQSACTQWEGVKSRSFNTFNGVKQGGVIPRSSFLFTMTSSLQECLVVDTDVVYLVNLWELWPMQTT